MFINSPRMHQSCFRAKVNILPRPSRKVSKKESISSSSKYLRKQKVKFFPVSLMMLRQAARVRPRGCSMIAEVTSWRQAVFHSMVGSRLQCLSLMLRETLSTMLNMLRKKQSTANFTPLLLRYADRT